MSYHVTQSYHVTHGSMTRNSRRNCKELVRGSHPKVQRKGLLRLGIPFLSRYVRGDASLAMTLCLPREPGIFLQLDKLDELDELYNLMNLMNFIT
jgi:hypothetical protein